MNRLKSQNGFTLIELLLGMTLLSIALLVVGLTYISLSRLQQSGASVRGVQQSSRYTLEAITRDVRNAAVVEVVSNSVASGANGAKGSGLNIISTLAGSSNITYRLEGEQLKRCVGTNCTNIASAGVRVTGAIFEIIRGQATDMPPAVKITLTVEQQQANLNPGDPLFQRYNLVTTVSPGEL